MVNSIEAQGAEQEVEARLTAILARGGSHDRNQVKRHLVICDGEPTPGHAATWRRLVVALGTLAPMPIRSTSRLAVQFYVADGPYRMQVFALEDSGHGMVTVYLPDVIATALDLGIVERVEDRFVAVADRNRSVAITPMSAANTLGPSVHVKDLIGWNRHAMRVTLDSDQADGPLIDLVEQLCQLAARSWEQRISPASRGH